MPVSTTCAILAAGAATRMGTPKAGLRVAGSTLLDRALAATAAYPSVLVAPSELADSYGSQAGVRVVRNDEPERGMTHSLRLADAVVTDRESALAVVLVDTPLVDVDLLARIVAARGDADVAYPVRAGVPGHPVVFGPAPRKALAILPDGDTLRDLRDDPRWTCVRVPVDDERPFFDCDTPADLIRAAELAPAVEPSSSAAKS